MKNKTIVDFSLTERFVIKHERGVINIQFQRLGVLYKLFYFIPISGWYDVGAFVDIQLQKEESPMRKFKIVSYGGGMGYREIWFVEFELYNWLNNRYKELKDREEAIMQNESEIRNKINSLP